MAQWEYCVVQCILIGQPSASAEPEQDEYELEGWIWERHEMTTGLREQVQAPEDFLRQLGIEGWELTSVVVDGWQQFRYSNPQDNIRLLGESKAMLFEANQPRPKYYFKRLLVNELA